MTTHAHKAPKPNKHERSDDGTAFLPDPYAQNGRAPARAHEQLAEQLAEDYVASATSGEPVAQERRDQVTAEEVGGPFIHTSASSELADDEDAANPKDATREPFPTATRGH